MRVVIIGAGGHGQVVADLLLRAWARGAMLQPIGYVDDNPVLWEKFPLELPVFGPLTQLVSVAHDAVIIAIGDNRSRARLFQQMQGQNERIVNAIHPSAVVAPDVRLGQGVMICAGTVINTGTTIGDDVILNTSCSVDHHSVIRDHAHLAPGVHLGGGVCVEEGALLGVSAASVPGRTIGRWSVVGAGAVVTHDIPAYATVVGVPARVIKIREA